MATIYGKFSYNGTFYDNYDDTLIGTSDADTIYGLGGDDRIWGAGGDDTMYGGGGDDVIRPEHPRAGLLTSNWGDDVAYGGNGDDTLDFQNTTAIVLLYGEDGNDQIFGGSNNDYLGGGDGLDQLYGEGGNDLISGDAGNDWVFGGTGFDHLYGGDSADFIYGESGDDFLYGEGGGNDDLRGGTGNDIVNGGAGGDFLTGGSGFDTFHYFFGSESAANNPDQITDFVSQDDAIDLSVIGMASNYLEVSISNGAGYNVALSVADFVLGGNDTYAFVTDQVDGYLFADFDANGTVDTGIILEGLTSLSDFSYLDLI